MSSFYLHVDDFSKCRIKIHILCYKPEISFLSNATSSDDFSILLWSPLKNPMKTLNELNECTMLNIMSNV